MRLAWLAMLLVMPAAANPPPPIQMTMWTDVASGEATISSYLFGDDQAIVFVHYTEKEYYGASSNGMLACKTAVEEGWFELSTVPFDAEVQPAELVLEGYGSFMYADGEYSSTGIMIHNGITYEGTWSYGVKTEIKNEIGSVYGPDPGAVTTYYDTSGSETDFFFEGGIPPTTIFVAVHAPLVTLPGSQAMEYHGHACDRLP